MNPCVFDVCQYLRVLILSCLSCSMVVIMIITSTQTDRQSIYGVFKGVVNLQTPKTSRVCSSMNLNSRNGPKGDNGLKASTHKATRKFHVFWWGSSFPTPFWCLMVSFIRPQVGENNFLPEKTQERKGFIYDDC